MVPKKFPGIGKEKDENMASSVFDQFLGEGKMPAAFAKFIKKKGAGKKSDGKNPFAKKNDDDDDDDDDDMDESVFDQIVTASGGSRFRLLKAEQAGPSAFDSLVAGGTSGTSSFDKFVRTESAEAAALDDKLAKTSALTESLAELKKKVLQS